MLKKVENLLIVGSGPAGLTAAIYGARAGLNPIVITGSTSGGLLRTTTQVDNYPGFKAGVDGNKLIDEMTEQATAAGARIHDPSYVELIEPPQSDGAAAEKSFFRVKGWSVLSNDFEVFAKTVILASGSTPKAIGVPGEEAFSGRGVSTCATCDGAFFKGKKVAVVGGGDSACEEAVYLSNIASEVSLLVRGDKLRASHAMQERLGACANLNVRLFTRVAEVKGNERSVQSLAIASKTSAGGQETVVDEPFDGLFVAVGHVPKSSLVSKFVEVDEHGYVITKAKSTATSCPGLFCAGDVQDSIYRQAVTAAGTGCMAAIEAQRYISEHNLLSKV